MRERERERERERVIDLPSSTSSASAVLATGWQQMNECERHLIYRAEPARDEDEALPRKRKSLSGTNFTIAIHCVISPQRGKDDGRRARGAGSHCNCRRQQRLTDTQPACLPDWAPKGGDGRLSSTWAARDNLRRRWRPHKMWREEWESVCVLALCLHDDQEFKAEGGSGEEKQIQTTTTTTVKGSRSELVAVAVAASVASGHAK